LGIIYILEICVILITVLIDSQKEKKIKSNIYLSKIFILCLFAKHFVAAE